MTCIVGLKTDEAIYIGGDGRVSRGWSGIDRDGAVKVFERDGIVYGASGSMRGAQVIQHALVTPRYHPDDDLLGYVAIQLTRAMRKVLKDNDAMRTDSDGEDFMGVWCAVACEGRLFEVGAWGEVFEPAHGEVALGSGKDLALGSLESTRSSDLSPEQRIMHAIVAAERHNSGVGDSITVAVVPINGEQGEMVLTTVEAEPEREEPEEEQPKASPKKPKGKKQE